MRNDRLKAVAVATAALLALTLAGPAGLHAQSCEGPMDEGDVYVGGAYENAFGFGLWTGWIGAKTGERTRLGAGGMGYSHSDPVYEASAWGVFVQGAHDLLGGPAFLQVSTRVAYQQGSDRLLTGSSPTERSFSVFHNGGAAALGYTLGCGGFSVTPAISGTLYRVSSASAEVTSGSVALEGTAGSSSFGPTYLWLGATVELFDTLLFGFSTPVVGLKADVVDQVQWGATLVF